jgi:hypothetical protein
MKARAHVAVGIRDYLAAEHALSGCDAGPCRLAKMLMERQHDLGGDRREEDLLAVGLVRRQHDAAVEARDLAPRRRRARLDVFDLLGHRLSGAR